MKRILLFLTFTFFVLQGFSQKVIADLTDFSGDFAFLSSNYPTQTKKSVVHIPKSSTVYLLDTFKFDFNYDAGVSTPFEPYSITKLTYDNDYYLIDEFQQIYNRDSARFYDNSEKIYTYDANHNKIQIVVKGVNSDGDLVYNSRYNMMYDANDNLVEKIYQVFNAAIQNWDNSFLDSFYYNNQNLKRLLVHYNYDFSSNQWQPSYKQEYEYDAFNNNIKKHSWFYNNGNWVNAALDSFYYQNGYLMLEVHYVWDDASSSWNYPTKKEYVYDINGNLIQKTIYNSNNDITIRIKYFYNSDNLIVHDTSLLGNNLIYYYSTHYNYDNFKNLTSLLKQRYDTSAAQWNNNLEVEYGYDTQKNYSDAIMPENYSQFFNSINVVSLPEQFLLKAWNSDSTDWINYYRFRYTYKTIVTSVGNISNSQQITLYPNPASNVININLPEEQSAFVSVYDANGRVVRTTKLVTGQVSVKSLPTGTYFVVVHGKNQIYVGKFLKK